LVLGGLIRQSDNKGRSGIPYLSRIPFLGALFRTTSKDRARSELVILIRPVVTMAPEEGIKLRERSQEYLKIEPDLESTVYPRGIRARVPPQETLRKTTVELRDTTRDAGYRK
jgi:general secretion pathway protein D